MYNLTIVETTHDLGLIASVLFGVTGGLLSLVGFITIFISINSQHVIEKARDTLSDLKGYTYHQTMTENPVRHIERLLNKYRSTTENGTNTKISVFLTIGVILSVGSAWWVFLWYEKSRLSENDFTFLLWTMIGATLIFMLFLYLIFRLLNLKRLGNVPSVDELMDTTNTYVFGSPLAISCMSFNFTQIQSPRPGVTLRKEPQGGDKVGFQFISKLPSFDPFYNYKARILFYFYSCNVQDAVEKPSTFRNRHFIKKEDSILFTITNDNKYDSHEGKVRIPLDAKSFALVITFENKNGTVTRVIDDLELPFGGNVVESESETLTVRRVSNGLINEKE
ncbi:hypothetical protein [Cohnella sp. GCM10027633]|uniref:hypothetical protein n=1 Tax=unclassified Cohnella TaxID=2636738 RepID=UPI003630E467